MKLANSHAATRRTHAIAFRAFASNALKVLTVSAGVAAMTSGSAVAQGITYTIAPAAQSIQWDSDFALKNHSLYGGQASIDFERLISLQGFYFTNDKINTAVDKLGLGGDLADQLSNQRVQVRSMGANVLWKFSSGGIAPFIKTGGGILELRPDSGQTSKHIMLNAGFGLRFGANSPIFLDIFADDMMLRADRYALFATADGTPMMADPDAQKLRHNLSFGAAIGIPLGLNTNERERNASQSMQWGLSGASLTLEPFAGRMTFDKKLTSGDGANGTALRDQELAGLRAGIDVGRYVGLRGFYWRATDKDFKRTESLQSWGGEMQFRLNSSPGLTPFLLTGAAKLDFDQSDTTSTAQRSEDKVALILGGGLAIPLGERFALNVTARDYMYGQGNGADSVSSPSDLRHNWMYTVGLRVSLAGRSGSREAERNVERQRNMRAEMREDSLRRLDDRRADRGDRKRDDDRDVKRAGNGDSLVVVDGRLFRLDSSLVARLKADSVRMDSVKRASPTPNMITIPAPTVGEFYVRYGPPPAIAPVPPMTPGSPADSAAQRAAAAAAAAGQSAPRPLTDAEREAAMNRRIDSLVNARVIERTSNLAAPPQPVTVQPVPVTVPPTANVNTPAPDATQPQPQPRFSWVGSDSRGGLMVYSGFSASSDPQLVIGGRFDLGSIDGRNSRIHLAPEIAFGGGSGGRSTMLVANAEYMFGKYRLTSTRTIQPHVYGGVGVLNFSDRVGSRDGLEGIINVGYGASIPLMRNQGVNRAAPVLTIEHQGIDFFSLNRLLVGLSWRL